VPGAQQQEGSAAGACGALALEGMVSLGRPHDMLGAVCYMQDVQDGVDKTAVCGFTYTATNAGM